MTTGKLMLICTRCSMRVHHLSPSDVPANGIVCGRCGHRMMPNEVKPDKARRLPAQLAPCELRGEQISLIDCGCSGGKVRVFTCSHADNTEGLALSYRPVEMKGLPEDTLASCRQCPFNREEPKPPTLLQMGISATAAAVGFVAGGGKTTTRETRESRLEVCGTCPAKNGNTCSDCGCLIAIKSWLPKEKCPRGKWPDASS